MCNTRAAHLLRFMGTVTRRRRQGNQEVPREQDRCPRSASTIRQPTGWQTRNAATIGCCRESEYSARRGPSRQPASLPMAPAARSGALAPTPHSWPCLPRRLRWECQYRRTPPRSARWRPLLSASGRAGGLRQSLSVRRDHPRDRINGPARLPCAHGGRVTPARHMCLLRGDSQG